MGFVMFLVVNLERDGNEALAERARVLTRFIRCKVWAASNLAKWPVTFLSCIRYH